MKPRTENPHLSLQISSVCVADTRYVVVEQRLSQIPPESGSSREQLVEKGLQKLISEEPATHVNQAFVGTVKVPWGPVGEGRVLRHINQINCTQMEDKFFLVFHCWYSYKTPTAYVFQTTMFICVDVSKP